MASVTGQGQEDDLRRLGAVNLAGWHDGMLRSLGIHADWEPGFWATKARVPVIYHNGISLRPHGGGTSAAHALAEALPARGRAISVCDSFFELDLRRHGFRVVENSHWLVRPPAPPTPAFSPSSLELERVDDLAGLQRWELASLAGFEVRPPAPGPLQGAAILEDARYQFWIGRAGGEAVATGLGFVDGSTVGIYAISVVPAARLRGYARAMTTRLLLESPPLPAVLQPSEAAASLYRAMGFEDAGAFRVWARP